MRNETDIRWHETVNSTELEEKCGSLALTSWQSQLESGSFEAMDMRNPWSGFHSLDHCSRVLRLEHSASSDNYVGS